MSITLQFVFEIDDVATDVTSAVLSDATGTYGVKRNDNDAVVVADGTAMTKVDTGTYEYSFNAPADGLTYTYCVEYVYDGNTYRESETYSDTTRVVTLSEAKDQMRITGTDEDTLINRLIDAATSYAEELLHRKLLTQTCIDYLDAFPTVIRPEWSPLVGITSIQYIDTDGATQTWSSAEYDVDTDTVPGRVQPAYGEDYPDIRDDMNAVTVTYTAGYGTAASDVPQEIRHWILLAVAHLYEHREASIETTLSDVPLTHSLLGIHRLIGI